MLDIRKYPLVSDQIDYNELTVIVRALEDVLSRGVKGAVVELGCYAGTTSLFIQRVLGAHNATDADDRHRNGACSIPHAIDRQRPNRRTA